MDHDIAGRDVSVRHAVFPAAPGVLTPRPQTLRLEGSLDRCDGERVSGWARFPQMPAMKPVLEVRRGHRVLATGTADLFRADLAQAGIGDGDHGFRIGPVPELADGLADVLITVRGSDSIFTPGESAPHALPRRPAEVYRRAPAARRFARCILHIGTEKTGSTSLQAFFGRNRAAFAEAGYVLPISLAPHAAAIELNHMALACVAMPDDQFLDGLRKEFNIADTQTLWAFREQVFRRLDDEIAAAPADCTTLLLSNEHCHSRLTTTERVAHLKAFLDPFCDRFEIRVYLRPQHDLAISRHGMMLMLGQPETAIFPPVEGRTPRAAAQRAYFDYAALLDRWAAVFGAAALRPRIFERAALTGGSVVRDFLDQLGLPQDRFVEAPDRGGNLSAAAQHFLIHLYRATGDQTVPLGRRLRLAEALRQIAPGQGMLPARAEAEAFLAAFSESNEAVRQRWFVDRPTLFTDDFARFPIAPPAPAPLDPVLFGRFVKAVEQAR